MSRGARTTTTSASHHPISPTSSSPTSNPLHTAHNKRISRLPAQPSQRLNTAVDRLMLATSLLLLSAPRRTMLRRKAQTGMDGGQEICLKRLLSICVCWNPLSGNLIGRTSCVVVHGMGDPGYDGVPFCLARKRENSSALLARLRGIFRPMAGQKWRVPTLVAALVASTSLKTVRGAGR